MPTALSVPLALSVPEALCVPEMYCDNTGIILKNISYTYGTKYIRVKFTQGPSSGASDGSINLEPSGIYSITGSISKVTVFVDNFSFTGMTGKTPCLYLSWCDQAGTVIGPPIALLSTTATAGASVSATASVSNPNGYSYFLLTFNDSVNPVPESFAVPLNVTMDSLTVRVN